MYNSIDAKSNDVKTNYHLLISGIVPRTIAFVGSKNSNGDENLAPFSFFNGFGANPPLVGFSPAFSGRTGKPKDTLLNIKYVRLACETMSESRVGVGKSFTENIRDY